MWLEHREFIPSGMAPLFCLEITRGRHPLTPLSGDTEKPGVTRTHQATVPCRIIRIPGRFGARLCYPELRSEGFITGEKILFLRIYAIFL